MSNIQLDKKAREELASWVMQKMESYFTDTKQLKVSSDWNINEVRKIARQHNLELGNDAEQVFKDVINGLTQYAVHTPHPNYFGLFNPRTSIVSALGDYIAGVMNPQMAAWSHAPFANEIETLLINEFGKKFGYPDDQIDGTFCGGGAESNHTAVLCALNKQLPSYGESGVHGIQNKPVIYCSSESHHSIAKAAKVCGIGTQAVKTVPVNEHLQMDINVLIEQIQKDKSLGLLPIMVVGTAGTTGAGIVDNLDKIADIAHEHDLWFHVDGAYGGAVIISNKHNTVLKGIERSDSITLDIHKWFSVPMAGSVFITQDKEILYKTFSITTNYMPEDGDKDVVIDPYIHSLQWSRRFIGLKAYLPIAVFGWAGFEKNIDTQISQTNQLRETLKKSGWKIENHTTLPVICFTHSSIKENGLSIRDFVDKIITEGEAWFSVYPIKGNDTIRICINNHATTEKEIEELFQLLEKHRKELG